MYNMSPPPLFNDNPENINHHILPEMADETDGITTQFNIWNGQEHNLHDLGDCMIDDNACSAGKDDPLVSYNQCFDFSGTEYAQHRPLQKTFAQQLCSGFETTAVPMHESRASVSSALAGSFSHAHHAQFKRIPLTERTYASVFAASLAPTAFAEHNAMQDAWNEAGANIFTAPAFDSQHAQINRHMRTFRSPSVEVNGYANFFNAPSVEPGALTPLLQPQRAKPASLTPALQPPSAKVGMDTNVPEHAPAGEKFPIHSFREEIIDGRRWPLRIISKTITYDSISYMVSKGQMSEFRYTERELEALTFVALSRYCVIESDNETLAHFCKKTDTCMDTVMSLNARLKGIDRATKRSKFKANTYIAVGDI